MKKRNYIFVLATMLLGTACNQEESISPTEQGNESILFTATIQKEIIAESRALGDNKKEKVALPYVNNIRVRKVDINSTKKTETQIFKVRTGNYGTLDMLNEEGEPGGTAMKWTDQVNTVDFYAWTVPTGVSIENDATTGIVNFAEGNKYNASSTNASDKFADVVVTPLETFIGAYTSGKYEQDPSVSLEFKHLVSKVKILVHRYDNTVITDKVTITFPYINKVWEIAQNQIAGTQGAFAISIPNAGSEDALTLNMTDLAGDKNGRYFYLPPMTGDYDFAKAGDFEIIYNGNTYYGSLADTKVNSGQLAAGEYMVLTIDLNENFNAGAGATFENWTNVTGLEAQADPYRGIYTVEGLKALKDYLASNDNGKTLPDSLYIDESAVPGEKKIIRLYNDLDLSSFGDGDLPLLLEKNMTFDGLGHNVTVPSRKSLFGDIIATDVKINNVRLSGAGTLANALTGVEVFNCHANGTGNLVGTAKDGTSFDFCSAEVANNLLAGTTNGTVTIQNCFVAYDGATKLAGTEGTVTAKNSFFFNTAAKTGTYYDENDSSQGKNITVDAQTGQLVVTTSTTKETDKTEKLIDLLNKASNTLNNNTTNETYWVYIYRKTYPVMRIK